MQGRPTGITYSKQPTVGTPRPVQTGSPVGVTPAAPTAAPAATANPTQTAPATGTTYLTINRGLLIAGLLFSLASPASFGLAGYTEFPGFFVIPTLLALILILSLHRAWTYLTSMIVGLLFPLFWTLMIAGHESGYNPASFDAFTITIVNLCAIPLIITGGVAGFRNARGKTGVSFGSGFRTVPGVFALCVCSILLGALVTSYAASENVLALANSGFDARPQATTSTLMQGFEFAPTTISVAATTYTEIVVFNNDPTLHTFTYQNGATEYNHDVLPGQTVSFVVFFETAGTYPFWCKPHSDPVTHEGMAGEIIVA